MTRRDDDVVMLDTAPTPEAREISEARERAIRRRKVLRDEIAQLEESEADLAEAVRSVAGAAGEARPGSAFVAEIRGRLRELRKESAELDGAIEKMGREIVAAETDAVAARVALRHNLQISLRNAAQIAGQVAAAAQTLGERLRDLHRVEREMYALASQEHQIIGEAAVQRIDRMTSLASLRERIAYGFGLAFEVDPDASGYRGRHVFIDLSPLDLQSTWRDKPLDQIVAGHLTAAVQEISRGRR